jgi:murein DD-endopeptidase MepM/ murein hydrolase activator NlpD
MATKKPTAKKKAPVKKAAVVAKVVEAPAPAKALDKTQTAAIKPTESAPSSAVIEEAEKDTVAAPNATGISKLRWPVRGRTLVGYGQADAGKANDGIDISVPNGTPVKSAENGVVIYAGTGLKDFGNTVLVRHDNGLVTVYGHNGDISVKRGQTVRRGQELAKSGMSGNTKVPKLHFEVRKNSKPINPATELE